MNNELDGSAEAIRKAAWPPDGKVYDECGPFTDDPSEREHLLKAWNEVMPKRDFNFGIGQVMIYGTGGDIDPGRSFKDLFYERGFKIIKKIDLQSRDYFFLK